MQRWACVLALALALPAAAQDKIRRRDDWSGLRGDGNAGRDHSDEADDDGGNGEAERLHGGRKAGRKGKVRS